MKAPTYPPALLAMLLGSPALAHNVSREQRRALTEGGHLDYMWSGAVHMLTGYDHLLFLFGVMFFLTKLGDILKFVTAFTIGHSITLLGATLLGVKANHYLIDAVIALSVIYKGFDNLDGFRKSYRHPPAERSRHGAWVRPYSRVRACHPIAAAPTSGKASSPEFWHSTSASSSDSSRLLSSWRGCSGWQGRIQRTSDLSHAPRTVHW